MQFICKYGKAWGNFRGSGAFLSSGKIGVCQFTLRPTLRHAPDVGLSKYLPGLLQLAQKQCQPPSHSNAVWDQTWNSKIFPTKDSPLSEARGESEWLFSLTLL